MLLSLNYVIIIAYRTGNNGVAICVPVILRGRVVETADFA
jgi:hypothetical protein